MTDFGEALMAPEAPEAAMPTAEPAPEFEALRLVGQLRMLDPAVPFGEGLKSVVASVAIYEQPDGTLTIDARHVDRAVGKGVEALQNDDESVGAQTDLRDPLALTEHEAAVVARWQAQGSATEAEQDEPAHEQDEDTGRLGVPLGRLVIGTATGLAGVGGGLLVAAPALAQPNQVPSPPAKVAQPFEVGLTDTIDLADSTAGTSLTPAELQECVKIATSIVPGPTKSGYTMYHAGIRGGTVGLPSQILKGRYWAEVLPDGSEPDEPDCTSEVQILENDQVLMQNPHHRSAWTYIAGDRSRSNKPIYVHIVNLNSPSGFRQVGVEAQSPGDVWLDWMFNQCPDGKHFLKVRTQTTLIAEDIQTDQILGKHTYIRPVKVIGNCAMAARSARIEDYKLKHDK